MLSVEHIRPLHVADLVVEGRTGPVYAYAVSHPDGLVLVDTGMIDSHPEIEGDYRPTLHPLTEHGLPLDEVVAVVNTHLHFDHCGGNRLFPGTPIYVQRAEKEAARGPDYTIPEWVDFPGARYELLDGEAEVVPGISVLPTPGHTSGHQSVVVATAEGPVVLAGDAAHSVAELAAAETEARRRIHTLRPRLVYVTHESEPWLPGG